jgi:hypothetical protein
VSFTGASANPWNGNVLRSTAIEKSILSIFESGWGA